MGVASALTRELFETALPRSIGTGNIGRYNSAWERTKDYAKEYVAKMKDYVKGIAHRAGYIPDYKNTKHLFDEAEEPQYMTHPEIQAKTTGPLVRRMREFYGKKFNIAPYISQVKERIGMLPVYAQLRLGRAKDGSIAIEPVPRGIVQGLFDHTTNEHTYSPLLLSDSDIREVYKDNPGKGRFVLNVKNWLKSYGWPLSSPEPVKAHEYGHYFQKVSGAIERYITKGRTLARRLRDKYWWVPEHKLADHISRSYIEGANTVFTNRMLGVEDRVYPHEKRLFRKLADKWGDLQAYLGMVPESELEAALA